MSLTPGDPSLARRLSDVGSGSKRGVKNFFKRLSLKSPVTPDSPTLGSRADSEVKVIEPKKPETAKQSSDSAQTSSHPHPEASVKSTELEKSRNAIAKDKQPEESPPKYEETPAQDVSSPNEKDNATAVKIGKQQIHSLWSRAIEKLPPADRLYLQGSGPVQTPDALIEETREAQKICIEKQLSFKWKGQVIKLRDVSEKILVWVRKFKEVGDVIVQVDPMHASLPWAAIRVVMQCALADSENFGNILIGVEKSTNIIGRCAIYEKLYLHPEISTMQVLTDHLIDLYFAILKFLVLSRRFYEKNTIARMTTGVFQDGASTLLGEIDEYEAVLLKDIDVAEAEARRREDDRLSERLQEKLGELLGQFGQPIARIGAQLDSMQKKLQDAERVAILCNLSEIEYEKHHYRARDGTTPGTCIWLIQHPKYQDWRGSSSSSTLWLRGDPGVGKSKLTAMVTETCLRHRIEHKSQEAIAYFYCDRNEHQRTADIDKIFLTLLKQLCTLQEDNSLPSLIVEDYEERKNKAFASKAPELRTCVKMIISLTEIYPQTTIIIDGLDEVDTDTRDKAIEALQEIVGDSAGLVKLFISSRNEDDIVAEFEDSSNHYISPGDNVQDIAMFVEAELESHFASKRLRWKLDDPQKMKIKQSLKDSANGMFLWVDYQVKSLSKLTHPDDIDQALKQLPKGLKETYDRIFTAIEEEDQRGKKVALAALNIVMAADTPLTAQQMVGAIYCSPGIEREFPIDTVLAKCHNLVVLDPTGLLRFNHLSCLEYLENYKGFSIREAIIILDTFCIQVLMQTTRTISMPFLFPISEYAARWWIQLTETITSQHAPGDDIGGGVAELKSLLREFIGTHQRPGKYFVSVIETLRSQRGRRQWYDYDPSLDEPLAKMISSARIPEPLLAGAMLGLVEIFNDSTEFDPDLTSDGGRYSLLMIASAAGHTPIVKMLLDRGADPAYTDGIGRDAFSQAIDENRIRVVELFLERGIHSKRSLSAAVINGNLDIMKLLIQKDSHYAISPSADDLYAPHLQMASYHGRLDIMKYIIDNRLCDINYSFGIYGTSLQAACIHSGGMTRKFPVTEVLEFLLQHGADVNASGGLHGTALQAACGDDLSSGSIEVVEFLLKHGADPNIPGGTHGSALSAAISARDPLVIKLLLDAGADLDDPANAQIFYGLADIGQYRLIKLLLKYGADFSMRGGPLGTPLHIFSRFSIQKMIQILIKEGKVNINALDWLGRTSLDVLDMYAGTYRSSVDASTPKFKELRSFLLENGARAGLSSSTTARKSHLRSCIRECIMHLLQDPNPDPRYNRIMARVLLALGDEQNSSIAFQIAHEGSSHYRSKVLSLQIGSESPQMAKRSLITYDMWCDGCFSSNPPPKKYTGHYYVCKTCIEVELCRECYIGKSPPRILPDDPESSGVLCELAVSCKNQGHEFLPVFIRGGGGDESHEQGPLNIFAKELGNDLRKQAEWLEMVKRMYSDLPEPPVNLH